jgi:PKD repeat protein
VRVLCSAVVALSLGACSRGEVAAAGASLAGEPDAPPPPALVWVDFVAAGCAATDQVPSCRGAAPLTLRFGAVAPRSIETYRWSFGDGGDDSTEPTPVHTFAAPGSYTVSLVAGAAGGSAQALKPAFVVVAATALGAACGGAGVCASGLSCVCGGGCAGVPPVCSRDCPAAGCAAGATCVAFARGSADWQRPLCLPTCSGDGDCPAGARCRELLGTAGWVKACWAAGDPQDEGASCVDGAGAPTGERCAGGSCAALGARGLCADACDATHPCPSYASCATMASGEHRCLEQCSATRACAGDPLLACQTPDPSGDFGFTVAGASAGATFCAPKRCVHAGDCGPDGTCVTHAGGSFCALVK